MPSFGFRYHYIMRRVIEPVTEFRFSDSINEIYKTVHKPSIRLTAGVLRFRIGIIKKQAFGPAMERLSCLLYYWDL